MERAYAIRVLERRHDDDTYFAYIAEPDKEDDFADETCWIKGNPSLGVTVRLEELREEFSQAREVPSKFSDFLRKRLDIWVESSSSWIPFETVEAWWKECAGPVDPNRLRGRVCYGGLDMSRSYCQMLGTGASGGDG